VRSWQQYSRGQEDRARRSATADQSPSPKL
jgi:hypothetical protein